jgi:hypothetical protein
LVLDMRSRDNQQQMFDLKPNYEDTRKRFAAFWNRDLLDRPLIQFSLNKPDNERIEIPLGRHKTQPITQLDVRSEAERCHASLMNQVFLGDTLPVALPNHSPAVMTVFYGCCLSLLKDGTYWNAPLGEPGDPIRSVTFDWQSPWLKYLHQMTDALLDAGWGRSITGMGNWFMGADCLAAILGPQRLAAALIEEPDWVRKTLDQLQQDFERLFNEFYIKLKNAGQPGTAWIPLLSEGKYYVVANDFSALVSNAMFCNFFLDGIIRECRFLDHSIYHLDGPTALRHLDTILEVKELDGVHFVPSPSDASFKHWMSVYKRIQDAGKCLIVDCCIEEIDEIPSQLKPDGLLLHVSNVSSLEEADELLTYVGHWPSARKS